MGLFDRVRGVFGGETDGDAAYRCVKCGSGFDRPQGVCPDCGSEFVAPTDEVEAADGEGSESS